MVLGFEETDFTVFEEDLFVELCVTVFEPPVIDYSTGIPVDIADIDIITHSQDGTTGILLLDTFCDNYNCIVDAFSAKYFLPNLLLQHF